VNRRDTSKALLALAMLPVDVNSQQPGKVYRVGVLTALPPVKPSPEWIQSLAKLGWVINQNLISLLSG